MSDTQHVPMLPLAGYPILATTANTLSTLLQERLAATKNTAQLFANTNFALNTTPFIGVGALFDFMSGSVRRAPQWVQRIRCEWLFRLLQEPRSLTRRYTVNAFHFLVLCARFSQKGQRS